IEEHEKSELKAEEYEVDEESNYDNVINEVEHTGEPNDLIYDEMRYDDNEFPDVEDYEMYDEQNSHIELEVTKKNLSSKEDIKYDNNQSITDSIQGDNEEEMF